MIGALPDWPQLMSKEMAAAYLSVGETQFVALTAQYRVAAVDLRPLRGVLWRRKDLDRLIDTLPLRGECSASSAPSSYVSPEDLAIQRAERRNRRA
jgi:hypothetical protein